MNFSEAIKKATLSVLSKSKKNLLFGQEVTNVGAGFSDNFSKQVFETPLSEAASTGLVVGLSTQGYKPQIVFGRVEFAMLAFDLIFTQAGRWAYTFGNKSKCPVNFRVQVGRQWGNGPQHTANYHSMFLQSSGLDIFIPSTPSEAYNHIIYMNRLNHPSVMLEHRYLTLIKEDFKIKKKITKPYNAKIYHNHKHSDLLLITYADTLIDALKAKKILQKNGINVAILNFSYFSNQNKIENKVIKFIEKFKNLLFVDSAPFEFGILSGVMSIISVRSKKKHNNHFLSPPNNPAPAGDSLMKNYYKTYNDIVNETCKILNKKKIKPIKQSFDEKILWPTDDVSLLK
tara:strand:+ start:1135 stop:2163 length:1029 start_codon:yes stop_codon:yes gene_type:complete